MTPTIGETTAAALYGDPGDRVIIGDWNGDRIDTGSRPVGGSEGSGRGGRAAVPLIPVQVGLPDSSGTS
jgi:hypothetical protein